MDGGVYVLAPDIRVLEEGDQRVLVNPANLEWVKLTLDAYGCAENREGLALGELVAREVSEHGAKPPELEALFSYLREAGFVVDAGVAVKLARAYLNVTDRCNLACPTCYFAAKGASGGDPLDAPEVCSLLEALARGRPGTLVVTGGEPLLRSDIADILDFAAKSFDEVVLLTNGTLIQEREAQFIRRTGVKAHVSLESSDAAAHDEVRGPGSFRAAVRGIDALLKAGVGGIRIVPTLTRRNLASVYGVVDLAGRLGVEYHFSLFMPVGRGACHAGDLAIPPSELLECFAGIIGELGEHGGVSAERHASGPPVELCVRRSCGAGREIVSVGPDGSVYPCPLMHLPGMVMGRLPRDPLSQICRQGRRLVPEAACIPGCRGCDMLDFCAGGCRAHSLAQGGDISSPDPYCGFYRAVYRTLLWRWRDDRPFDENVQALLAGLSAGCDPS